MDAMNSGLHGQDVAPAAAVGHRVAREVFAGLPRRYGGLAWLLSFGQDRRWRQAVVDHVAASGPGRVLYVATGPAGVALAIARATSATVVGVDLNEPMLRQGLANVRAANRMGQVVLAAGRGERLPLADASVDAISFSYLLRYVEDPAATIAEMARCLRPGGTMASLEFYVPPNRGWRAAWNLYVRAVLPAAGGWPAAGPGGGWGVSSPRASRRYPLDGHLRAWERAGMRDVGWRVMSVGGGLVMWGTKRDGP